MLCYLKPSFKRHSEEELEQAPLVVAVATFIIFCIVCERVQAPVILCSIHRLCSCHILCAVFQLDLNRGVFKSSSRLQSDVDSGHAGSADSSAVEKLVSDVDNLALGCSLSTATVVDEGIAEMPSSVPRVEESLLALDSD